MQGDARLLIGIVGEDELHASLAVWLVRRAVQQRVEDIVADWARGAELLRFRAAEGDGRWSKWAGARERLKARLPALKGRPIFLDEAAELREYPKALAYAAVVRLAELEDEPVDAVVLFEDTDGDDLGTILQAARSWFNARKGKVRTLVICTPHQEVEAWIVAGLADDPRIATQRKAAKKALGFDPCLEAHRLPSAVANCERDPKRVLGALLDRKGVPQDFPGEPPAASTHDELLERAFVAFDRLRASPVGRATGLCAAWNAICDEIAVLAVPGPP